MTYKMNGFPQLGGDKNKKPKTLESKVNAYLGFPKERAIKDVNARYTEGGDYEEGRDRARHMTTAQYVTEAVRDKLDRIPFSNSTVNRLAAAGISNVFGAAHEIKAGYANIKKGKPVVDTIIETAEDMTNNFAGSTIGAMDGTKADKKKMVDSEKLKSMLPDGIYRSKGDNTYK